MRNAIRSHDRMRGQMRMNESGSSTWELLVQGAMNEVTLQQSLMIATVKRDSEKNYRKQRNDYEEDDRYVTQIPLHWHYQNRRYKRMDFQKKDMDS